jgi:predicted transposase YdaD
MKESSTYQAILREGRAEGKGEGRAEGKAEEAKRILLSLGRKRFGAPKAEIKQAIGTINDLDRLEQLTVRLLEANNWDELVAAPWNDVQKRR